MIATIDLVLAHRASVLNFEKGSGSKTCAPLEATSVTAYFHVPLSLDDMNLLGAEKIGYVSVRPVSWNLLSILP